MAAQESLQKAFGNEGKSSLNIDKFRAEVVSSSGFARTNKYEVRINPPAALTDADMIRQLVMRCESVNMPGVNLTTASDSNIYGPSRDIVEGVTYAETVDMSFILDKDLRARIYFQDWQHLAYNPHSWNLNYYNEYIGTIDVFILDNDLKPTYGIRLWEAYPKTISAISLSNTTDNEIARMTISIEYRYWSDLTKFGDQEPTKTVGFPSAAPAGSGDPDFGQAAAGRDRRALEKLETARANKPKKIVPNHSRTRRPPGIGAG